MSDPDYSQFPFCMHALAAAMHRNNINPGSIRISLPFDAWWRLWNVIEQKHRGMLRFDGRGACPDEFQYMGFKFVVEKA